MFSIWNLRLYLLIYFFLYVFHVIWLFWWIYEAFAHVWSCCRINFSFIIWRYIILSISIFFPFWDVTSLSMNIFIMMFVLHQFKINWLNLISLTSIIVGKDIRFDHTFIKNMATDIHLRKLTLIRILMLLFIIGYRFLRVRLGKREWHMLILFKVILCF